MVVSGKRLYFYFSGSISRYTLHRAWERSTDCVDTIVLKVCLCSYRELSFNRYILVLKLLVCGKSIPSDHKLCRWIPNLALLIRISCARYLVPPFSVAYICKENDKGVALCNVATANPNEKFWVSAKSHSRWGKKTSETTFKRRWCHPLTLLFSNTCHIYLFLVNVMTLPISENM